MKNLIEPYLKENNLLQLPLFFFGKGREARTEVQWQNANGNYTLTCDCSYGVPGSFEQDVYTATMRIWLAKGMPSEGIKLNYSDICRELHLSPPMHYVGQIKAALQKLAHARYEFKQCFLQVEKGKPTKVDTHFSLYDSASLFSYNKSNPVSKRNGESRLIFPKEIQQNIEAHYYQLLDMVWYRSLPEGLPRRLYEYLEKRRYHSIKGTFMIAEEAICRWLPVTTKNITERRKILAHIAQALIDAKYLRNYEFDKQKKLCMFTYAKKLPLEELSQTIAKKKQQIKEMADILPSPGSIFANDFSSSVVAQADNEQPTTTEEEMELQEKQWAMAEDIYEDTNEIDDLSEETIHPTPTAPIAQNQHEQVASIAENRNWQPPLIVENQYGKPALLQDNQNEPTIPETNALGAQEVVTPANHRLYLEALNWLDSIPYFHKARKQEIAAMSINEVARLYHPIQAEYEKRKASGKRTNAGWVYQAFMEKWDFTAQEKTERVLNEDRRLSAIQEAYEELPESKQMELLQGFEQAYSGMSELLDNEYVWLRYIEKVVLPK